jgi:hypothetical protein
MIGIFKNYELLTQFPNLKELKITSEVNFRLEADSTLKEQIRKAFYENYKNRIHMKYFRAIINLI